MRSSAHLRRACQSGVQENWRELRAVDEQLESITEDFDGEDVLQEHTRDHPDEATSILASLHEQLQKYTLRGRALGFDPYVGGIVPEPSDDEAALVRELVDKVIESS